MYYALCVVLGVAAGAAGYHFLFNPIVAEFDVLHARFDELLAKVNSALAALKK